MKKTARRFLSMLLALSMVFGMLVFPVSATENEESAAPVETAEDAAPAAETAEEAEPASQEDTEVPVVNVSGGPFNYSRWAESTSITLNSAPVPEDVEVDENAPEIIAVTNELKDITVLNDDGESVPLTEGQIQAVLAYYQQYLVILSDNRNIYGIQTPFFLNFNDEGEDGLGILGEMLVLAGYSVEDVRAGNYAYMDLVMMIKTFTYTYGLGAEYYGNAILNAQKEALQAVEDSGAKTEAQKLLALNAWLAQNNTFDMPYIMNTDKDENGTIDDDEKIMAAPNGSPKNENYEKVQAYVEDDLTTFFTDMFKGEIKAGFEADLRKSVFEGYIKSIYAEGVLTQMIANEDIRKEAATAYVEQQIWQDAYDEYLENHCNHSSVSYEFKYDEAEDGKVTATATMTCNTCGIVYEDPNCEIDEEVITPATCKETGKATYTATAHFKNSADKEIAVQVDQETYTKVLPVDAENGHTVPTTAKFTWSDTGTGTEATSATATCSACEKVFTASAEEGTVKTTVTDRKAATCGDGYVKMKAEATFTINGEPVVLEEEKTDVLPGSGEHDYNTEGVCTVCGETKPDDAGSEEENGTDSEEENGTDSEENPNAGTDVVVAAEAQTVLNADAETASNTEATTVVHTFDGTLTLNETEEQIEADAKAAADKALEDARADGTVADMVGALTTEEVDALTEAVVRGGAKDSDEDKATETDYEKDANKQAEQFVEDNQDAISEDPAGFLKNMLAPEGSTEEQIAQADAVVDQAEAQATALIEQAATEGIEVAVDENGDSIIMTTDEIVAQTMASEKIVDMDGDGEGDTTANDAIPMYVQGATPGLTDATINGWKGCHIGAFGFGTSVCLGYAMAYTYLIQCMHPEVYGTSENADMTQTANWKTRDEVYGEDLDSSDYLVDTVRVTFDTEVTMFGPDNSSNFGEVHFWNAVKVDGQWYYIDPCYVDVYVEVMSRDRVETDGNMNHLYFMFSHTSAVDMYDGYTNTTVGDDNSGITSLYANKATDQSYEDSWISRINCVPYFADGYAYYVYDSTDLLTILEDSESNPSEVDYDASYKLVRHDLSKNDKDDGDEDYFTLIAFNGENSDGEVEARVYDPEGKETVRNELLTELVKRHTTYAGVYPSVEITSVLYDGKLYFNLANCILSIDLDTYEVALVKEYNTVYGVRDDNVDFGGRAFSVTTEANADFTVENHPIAALSLKDGQLTVSIATNFALISGKKDRTNPAIALEDGTENGYGYEYEESNFNPNYNTYFNSDEGEQYGYEEEINDNDEFMWSANFVDTLTMSHFAGSSHTYEEVTVAAFCDMDGFTENRCSDCGAIEADSRVTDEGTAHEHHFVEFNEVYYTKDDSGSWNRGTSYVCAMCSYAVDKPTEPGSYADEEEQQEYEDKLAEYEAAKESAGHTYIPDEEDENTVWADDNTSVTFQKLKCSNVCPTRQPFLDALLEDDSISVTLKESVNASAEVADYEGDCTTGAIAVYVASGEAEGYAYTATNKVQLDPGTHAYEGDFNWTEVEDEDGNPTGEYAATASVTCAICGDHHEDLEAVVTLDEEKSTAPSCTVDGENVYVATVTVTDDEGNEIGSASETKEVPVEKLGHQFNEDGICEVCGAGDIRRIYGQTRYETAMAVADELKKELGVETFTTILVANGGDYPDALAGSYLAMQNDAPILLTENKADSKTNGTILDYIEENLRSDGMVYILGGTGSVPKEFADSLEEAGIAFQRLAGANRYETALKILEKAGLNGNEILVCSGGGYADALSISAVNKPVLLVNGTSTKLSDAQMEYLDALNGDYTFYIVGGTGTVSVELEEVFKTYGTVERVAGDNRHATSVAVAEKFYPNADCATLAPSMNNFADGLCGGPLAYRLGAPLLLVSANNEAGAAKYVEERNIEKGVVFGGSYWIPDDSVRTVFGLDEDATIG